MRKIGQRINATIRETDFAGRLGGEEFAWVMPETAPDEALVAAERLRMTIAATPLADLVVTISTGLATLRANEDESALLIRADRLLYEAKAAGRNHVSTDGAANHAQRGPIT